LPRWEQDDRALGPIVQGFTASGFSIDGSSYEGALLTSEWVQPWSPPPIGELTLQHLEPLLGGPRPPEFLILGTGPAMAFPPRALVRAVEERGMGIEAMDSRAAARTWGMLRGEGRHIVAALMPLA
jgi:uncharacterized protein